MMAAKWQYKGPRIAMAAIDPGREAATGLIALESLLKIALVLDCLADFDRVCVDDERGFAAKSLDEILARPKTRKKGRIK